MQIGNSKPVWDCTAALNKLGGLSNITEAWVPRHEDHKGNEQLECPNKAHQYYSLDQNPSAALQWQ